MKTERGETIALIISIFAATAIAVLCAFAIASMNEESSEEWKAFAERKAYCDSIGGHYGAGKCYVNGEEMSFGGEE